MVIGDAPRRTCELRVPSSVVASLGDARLACGRLATLSRLRMQGLGLVRLAVLVARGRRGCCRRSSPSAAPTAPGRRARSRGRPRFRGRSSSPSTAAAAGGPEPGAGAATPPPRSTASISRGPAADQRSRAPRLVIPFADEPRKSRARQPRGRSRERRSLPRRGERQPHLPPRRRPRGSSAVAVGLNHLLGGSALALDRARAPRRRSTTRARRAQLRSESPLPPSLSWLADEDYRGPWSIRIDSGRGPAAAAARSICSSPIFPRRESPCAGRGAAAGGSSPWRRRRDDDLVLPELRRRGASARSRRRASARGAPSRRALPSHQHGHGPRRQRLRLRRLSDPPDLPDLAGRRGAASSPSELGDPAASCSTPGEPSTWRRRRCTASSASPTGPRRDGSGALDHRRP